jgi:P2 family phage contractile tail tube protein
MPQAPRARQVLREFNILIEGIGNVGISNKVELPDIEFLTIERDGAMAKEEVIPLLKTMVTKITLSEYNTYAYTAASKQFGSSPVFYVKGSLIQGDETLSLLATIIGKVKKFQNPLPERGKNVEQALEIATSAYSLELGGVRVIDIDVDNLICEIDGVDLFQELRNHIL